MKILITGGSGFIGTRVVEKLLSDGHDVKIYDIQKSVKYPELTVEADVRDGERLVEECEGIDIIYNLAAEHADDVKPLSLYAQTNIGGAENIVNAARKCDIKRVVFTSSVAVYGLNRGTPDEKCEPRPFNEYGRTKYEAEKIFESWANEDTERSLTIVRPSVIFGEGNRGNVYNLIRQIKEGKFLMIGDGKNRKSMGYVENIAEFLSSLTEADRGCEIYNFAGKPDLSSREIVDIIYDTLGMKRPLLHIPYPIGVAGGYLFDFLSTISGKNFPISSIRIKKFTAETTIDTKKLHSSGFESPYSLEEGLRRMITHDFLK
jgi:nucleoside-diphosphate-sugar epimerase